MMDAARRVRLSWGLYCYLKDCVDETNEGKGEDMKGFVVIEGVILEDSRMWVGIRG